jgi:hypothetical protein
MAGMHERTRRLGLLDAGLCERLLAEVLRREFTPHARGRHACTGPLRHGETAHILELTPTGHAVYEDNRRHFPVFRSFIESLFAATEVGKSYWHRLKAAKSIYTHIDCGDYYDRTHRFQLFPSMEAGHVALLDSAEERFASGTLLAFDPSVPHAYENRSEKDCVFLVFDLYPGSYRLPGLPDSPRTTASLRPA